MTVAQKVAFELVPVDGPIGGFQDAHATAAALADAISEIAGLDRTKLLLFGGWESATRGAGVTLHLRHEDGAIFFVLSVLVADFYYV